MLRCYRKLWRKAILSASISEISKNYFAITILEGGGSGCRMIIQVLHSGYSFIPIRFFTKYPYQPFWKMLDIYCFTFALSTAKATSVLFILRFFVPAVRAETQGFIATKIQISKCIFHKIIYLRLKEIIPY